VAVGEKGFMKYAVLMGFLVDGMIYMPSIIKIGSGIQNLIGGYKGSKM
jgi:hypothetical protein